MKKGFIIHPLLLSIYPSLFLYSRNLGKIRARDAFASAILIAAISTLLWLILNLIIRNRLKSGFIVSMFLCWFFFYSNLFEVGKGFKIGSVTIWRHKFLFTAWCLAFATIGILALKHRGGFHTLGKIGNLFSSLLAIFCLVTIFTNKPSEKPRLISTAKDPEKSLSIGKSTKPLIDIRNYPDIFYIILDAYAGQDALGTIYEYDNSGFYNYLTNKGFFLARKSTSNYNITYFSFPSFLNMDYIHKTTTPSEDLDLFPIYDRTTKDNKLLRFLKDKGYFTVNIGFNNEFSDRSYYYKDEFDTESQEYSKSFSRFLLTNQLFKMTFLYYYFSSLDLVTLDFGHRDSINFAFNKLKEARDIEGPKFVFSHILAPHPPFVFGPNGEKTTLFQAARIKPRDLYIRQLKYINKKTCELIDYLLMPDKPKPLIVIQGDHGARIVFHSGKIPRENLFDNQTLEDDFKILNAYYFPDHDYRMLYESISPVNSFRLILNKYFKTDFNVLSDESFLCIGRDFINISDRLHKY